MIINTMLFIPINYVIKLNIGEDNRQFGWNYLMSFNRDNVVYGTSITIVKPQMPI